jgi:DNA-directed RNA polymerase subunit RPC12/RpoP
MVQNLIAFIASVAIIAYFLVMGRYLRRIAHAVEKLAGMKLHKTIRCSNCGKEINLGVAFRDQYTNCPRCNYRIKADQEEIRMEKTIEKTPVSN